MSIHLILGGARSGKSGYAEEIALDSGLPVIYLATALVLDEEFRIRVTHHQTRRPTHWQTIENPFHLGLTLSNLDRLNQLIIVDCLTLWLAQCICPECEIPKDVSWLSEKSSFLETLPKLKSKVILVSNEVGMGIVPLGEISRYFQDEQGRLNQAVASIAETVSFIAAGLPIKLKG